MVKKGARKGGRKKIGGRVVFGPKNRPQKQNPPRSKRRMMPRAGRVQRAPAIMGMQRMAPVGAMMASHTESTRDYLGNVNLGSTQGIVWNTQISPQDLPITTRANSLSRLYAEYRMNRMRLIVQSATGTATTGEYGVYYDPNPDNTWKNGASIISRLTNLPVQSVGAAWESVDLVIPGTELSKKFFSTDQNTREILMSRIGQAIIATIVPPSATNTTLAVYLEANWTFRKSNVTMENEPTGVPVVVPPTTWTVKIATGTGVPNGIRTLYQTAQAAVADANTPYRCYPPLPANIFADAPGPIEWYASHTYGSPGIVVSNAFETYEGAYQFANNSDATTTPGLDMVVGTYDLPQIVLVPETTQG